MKNNSLNSKRHKRIAEKVQVTSLGHDVLTCYDMKNKLSLQHRSTSLQMYGVPGKLLKIATMYVLEFPALSELIFYKAFHCVTRASSGLCSLFNFFFYQ